MHVVAIAMCYTNIATGDTEEVQQEVVHVAKNLSRWYIDPPIS